MPAITRSQSRKQSINVPQNETQFFSRLNKLLPEKINSIKQSQLDTSTLGFFKYLKKMIQKCEDFQNESELIILSIAETKLKNVQKLFKKHREIFYNKLRVITEIYYNILDWFDTILVVDGVVKYQNLINAFYKKYVELKPEIIAEMEEIKTKEEKHIFKICLDQLQETSALLEPYVSDNIKTYKPEITTGRLKRNQKIVDYTGMDTIEPLNKYDTITNIWEDTTIYEDPDYQPSDEESEEESDETEDKIVGVRVSNNHIRFI